MGRRNSVTDDWRGVQTPSGPGENARGRRTGRGERKGRAQGAGDEGGRYWAPASSGAAPLSLSHPRRTTLLCLSSPILVPPIGPARGAPPSSPLFAVQGGRACIATTPAASAPTSTDTASNTSGPSGRSRRRHAARRGPAQATNAASRVSRSATARCMPCELRCVPRGADAKPCAVCSLLRSPVSTSTRCIVRHARRVSPSQRQIRCGSASLRPTSLHDCGPCSPR